MVLDEVGADTSKNYHQLSHWGMDILKVGSSLAAGSLAMQVPLQNGRDTLVRLGGANMGKVYYQRIADGPVRAIFRMHYPGWKVRDGWKQVDLTEEIQIWGGQYFYESKVMIDQAPPGSKLVTGLVNLYKNSIHRKDTASSTIAFTWGMQSENKDHLGMAVLTAGNNVAAILATPDKMSDILNTYAITFKPYTNKISFRFYACWEKTDQQFSSEKGFRDFLLRQAALKKQMILIK
jgi:hypothetical protein